MAITICFDFGNIRLKAAVFEQDQLKEIVILNNESQESMEEMIQQFKPKGQWGWGCTERKMN